MIDQELGGDALYVRSWPPKKKRGQGCDDNMTWSVVGGRGGNGKGRDGGGDGVGVQKGMGGNGKRMVGESGDGEKGRGKYGGFKNGRSQEGSEKGKDEGLGNVMGGKGKGRGGNFGQGSPNSGQLGQKNNEEFRALDIGSLSVLHIEVSIFAGLKFSAFKLKKQISAYLDLIAVCSVDLLKPGTLQREDELFIRLARHKDFTSRPSLHSNPSTGGMSSL